MTTPVGVAACGIASTWGSSWQWKDIRAVCYFTVAANGSWSFLILIMQRNVLVSPEHFFLLTCDCHCSSNVILDPLLRGAFGKGGEVGGWGSIVTFPSHERNSQKLSCNVFSSFTTRSATGQGHEVYAMSQRLLLKGCFIHRRV